VQRKKLFLPIPNGFRKLTKLGADLPRNGLRELQANLFSAQLLAKQKHQLSDRRLGCHVSSTHHPYSKQLLARFIPALNYATSITLGHIQ
jgi:hypothetical protein